MLSSKEKTASLIGAPIVGALIGWGIHELFTWNTEAAAAVLGALYLLLMTSYKVLGTRRK